ncbi:uncharacterized protein [Palaemon carinicauda]|uniref:uncharacterized protein n=1 Tax=Palaemon carinicauda TaxID=392227 RepID=UPI0035B62891
MMAAIFLKSPPVLRLHIGDTFDLRAFKDSKKAWALDDPPASYLREKGAFVYGIYLPTTVEKMPPLRVYAVFLIACGCALPAFAQNHHEITGVLQPDLAQVRGTQPRESASSGGTWYHNYATRPRTSNAPAPEFFGLGSYDDIVSASIDILPEITDVLDHLSATAASSSSVSDPSFIKEVLDRFIPLSKKVYISNAKTHGYPIKQDQISRLNAAERVIPPVFDFMKRMRDSRFFGREVENEVNTRTGFTPGTFEFQTPATRNISRLPYGKYTYMVDATKKLLPVMASVLRKITSDPDAPEPTDPNFIEKMMAAFLPATKEILVAAALAEGRVPRKEEFDQIDQSVPVMPNVFNFMERLRRSDFYTPVSGMKNAHGFGFHRGTRRGFSAGSFKFDDNEQSTLIRSETLPKPGTGQSWTPDPRWGTSASAHLPPYEWTVPKPEGYYEVYKGTSLARRPSRVTIPVYKHTL